MSSLPPLDLPDPTSLTKIVTCTVEGVLEEEDLLALVAGQAEGKPPAALEDPTNLAKIRERHHGVARQIAAGYSQTLVARICGYTDGYLSVLLNNPAMQELVEMYRLQHASSTQLIAESLRTVGLKALEKLNDKLEADEITDTHELVGVAKLGLDRAGHGPTSTQHTISEHHLIDHAQLKKLNDEARAQSKGYIVPVREVRAALAPPAPLEQESGDEDS